MILGVGADLCHVERIRRSLLRFGDAWIDHLFSQEERRLCAANADPGLLYARGFCGKEACAKALATGLADGVDWRDIEVLQSPTDTRLRLTGAALDRLTSMTPQHHRANLIITCSGDRRLAQAFVLAFAISE
jgi:holo-[acyl-carrier protein] synthase